MRNLYKLINIIKDRQGIPELTLQNLLFEYLDMWQTFCTKFKKKIFYNITKYNEYINFHCERCNEDNGVIVYKKSNWVEKKDEEEFKELFETVEYIEFLKEEILKTTKELKEMRNEMLKEINPSLYDKIYNLIKK